MGCAPWGYRDKELEAFAAAQSAGGGAKAKADPLAFWRDLTWGLHGEGIGGLSKGGAKKAKTSGKKHNPKSKLMSTNKAKRGFG